MQLEFGKPKNPSKTHLNLLLEELVRAVSEGEKHAGSPIALRQAHGDERGQDVMSSGLPGLANPAKAECLNCYDAPMKPRRPRVPIAGLEVSQRNVSRLRTLGIDLTDPLLAAAFRDGVRASEKHIAAEERRSRAGCAQQDERGPRPRRYTLH